MSSETRAIDWVRTKADSLAAALGLGEQGRDQIAASLAADPPPSWRLSRWNEEHPDPWRACPRCGVDLTTVGIVDLAYVFDACGCDRAPYAHLIEQMWHRRCHAIEAGDQAARALDDVEDLVRQRVTETLVRLRKALLAEAARGADAAPVRQHITYEGGLRRAASIAGDFRERLYRAPGRLTATTPLTEDRDET